MAISDHRHLNGWFHRFRLEAAEQRRVPPDRSNGESTRGSFEGFGVRLVIVEDEPGVRELLRAAVQSYGWEVEAGPSASALTYSIAHADLITLDVHLEDDENGLVALRAYRKGGGTAPVVVLTADDSERTRRAAKRAGATAVVVKPFEVMDLLELLTRLVAAHHEPPPQTIDLREEPAVERPWYSS